MKYFLATTAISNFWDIKEDLLLLGPWCLTEESSKKLIDCPSYSIVPPPWGSAEKIKDAAEYTQHIYKEILPLLADKMNRLHGISYPNKYWQILLGPWLLHFIESLYERYSRIKNTLGLFPDFHTSVLPAKMCSLISYDTYDFLSIRGKVNDDWYNLKLFSRIIDYLCPDKSVEVRMGKEIDEKRVVQHDRLAKRLFYGIKKIKDIFSRPNVILSDMHRIGCMQILYLELRAGPNSICFKNFGIMRIGRGYADYSEKQREMLKFNERADTFQTLLRRLIPCAIPMCYIENFKKYKENVNREDVKIIGSAVGWYCNEKFKFYAAEASLRGTQVVEFQHGGGYGMSLSVSPEFVALEKDAFYTWGWESAADKKAKPLPSPYLSKLKKSAKSIRGNFLYIGAGTHRYVPIFGVQLLSDDMHKYFNDKKIFFESLAKETRVKIEYRPYAEIGWREINTVRKLIPDVRFSRNGALTDRMRESGLVIIDHLSTTFIEALTINAPCVLFWDRAVHALRPEAEPYFDLLRKAGILHETPQGAARKVEEILHDPSSWWMSEETQELKDRFCQNFALTSENWVSIWRKELGAGA